MPGELLQNAIDPVFMGQAMEYGQDKLAQLKPVLAGAGSMALVAGGFLVKSKMAAASHDKPSEVSEARIRVLKPWESGLLFKNGTLYDSIPVMDASGRELIVDGQPQCEKKFHKLLTPGFRHGLMPLRKMLIVSNLPDQFKLPLIRAEGPNDRLSDLEASIIWHHVSATDEHGREASYAFNADAPDGKSWKAGPIAAAEALNRAVRSATTRAEKAKQLGSILVPVIQSRLQGESEPLQAAIDPAFSIDVKSAVHDRFLARGAILDEVNVGASFNPEVRGHKLVADAIKCLPEAFANGESKKPAGHQPHIDIASQVASQEPQTGFGLRPAAHVQDQ